jgi:hypothetical protein
MMCPACYGTGYKELRSYPGNELFPYPCEVCESRGVIHCCEGDQANDPPVAAHRAFDIFDVRRPHIDGADCWCEPTELDDGELLHWNVT